MKPLDECKVAWCHESRIVGAWFCSPHLSDYWGHRLVKTADGLFIGTAGPVRRPAWLERSLAKDFTGRQAA